MKKACIVDDIKGIQLLLRRCLEAQGFEVQTCGDGAAALELLAAEAFDLIVLDIKLPHVSGTDVLKRLREAGVSTPVIIVTAFGSIRNAIDCTKLGVIAYIQKPFSENKILSVLGDFGLLGAPQSGCAPDEWEQRRASLLKQLAEEPLNTEIYRQLAAVSRLLGRETDAAQFLKISESFGR